MVPETVEHLLFGCTGWCRIDCGQTGVYGSWRPAKHHYSVGQCSNTGGTRGGEEPTPLEAGGSWFEIQGSGQPETATFLEQKRCTSTGVDGGKVAA